MFCSKCGNQVSDNARFCNACGAPLQTAPAPAPKPAVETDEFGVPVAPKTAAPKPKVETDEFGVPVAPKTAAPKPKVETDEFGVPVAPKTAAPKPAVETDEFGVPVAPKTAPAPEVAQYAPAAPQVDQFGVPVYAQGGSAVAAKPVNKKLIYTIGGIALAAIIVIVLIIVLAGGGAGGGKSSKMSVIDASLDAMCNDPGDIVDLMHSSIISMVGEGLSKSEMKDDLRDEFEEYEGYTVKSSKIENESSSDYMLQEMNSMLGTSFDEYCVAYCTVVLEDEDGDTDEESFSFHLVKDGGKWYLMYFE